MANFGVLSGKKIARSAMRTARFVKTFTTLLLQEADKRIAKDLTRRAKALEKFTGISGQAEAILTGVHRFFDSTPGQADTFRKVSYDRLNQQDSTAQIKLKQRAIAEVQALSREALSDVLEAYARGRLSIEAFGVQTRAIIRRQALAAAVIGAGGIANLTENILTAVNRQITEQFALLDGFIDDLATKGRDVDAKDRARARQYANSAFAVASNVARQFQLDRNGAGNLEERRRLGGAEHCEDCLELEGEGWQEAGSLPAIGQGTVCGANCHCWIEVRVKSDNDISMNDASV